jgi:WD40 repeat protein
LPEPTARLMESVAILEGSTGPVYSLDWSPDGNVLASAGHSQVNLWGDGWEANQPVGSYELRMGD